LTPCDLAPKSDEVPVLTALSAVANPAFPLLVQHQTEEFERVYREIDQRVEAFFHGYGVARTGDDLVDFRVVTATTPEAALAAAQAKKAPISNVVAKRLVDAAPDVSLKVDGTERCSCWALPARSGSPRWSR
jgi:hypothetical protein